MYLFSSISKLLEIDLKDQGEIPLFLFLLTVPSSLFKSPLLEAEDILLGPVGFLAGTPPNAPDKDRGAERGDPPS